MTYLAPERKSTTAQGYEGYANGSYFVGEDLSYYTWYIPKYAGVDQTTGLSMWYKDVTDAEGNVTRETTTTYSEATNYLCGTALPDLYGGFSTSFQFFGVDVSASFAYQIGGLSYDSGYASGMASPYSSSAGSNLNKDILKSWTPENPSTTIPRFQYGDNTSVSTSDRFLLDASYLNISNIQVGYTLPESFTRKFGVGKLRIYLACDNVYYWSRRQLQRFDELCQLLSDPDDLGRYQCSVLISSDHNENHPQIHNRIGRGDRFAERLYQGDLPHQRGDGRPGR